MTIIFNEPDSSYFSNPAVSFHKLRAFERSPRLYQRLYLTHQAERQADTPALVLGKAAHALILEGEAKYLESFTILGEPIDRRTSAGKAAWEYAQSRGLPILKQEDDAEVRGLAAAVREHAHAALFLAPGQGSPEVAIRHHPEGPYSFPIQGRLDWLSNDRRQIIDLKTCEDMSKFVRDVEHMAYYRQLAFYQELLWVEQGYRAACYIVAVEKSEPKRCAVYQLSADYLALGRIQNNDALHALNECYTSDVWPTGVEGVTSLEPGDSLMARCGQTTA